MKNYDLKVAYNLEDVIGSKHKIEATARPIFLYFNAKLGYFFIWSLKYHFSPEYQLCA
jgi:hypothetical protein